MSKNQVVATVTVLFAIISLVGILFHEIWMDEAHHWLLARDSDNLIDLWENTRYEGHPILWNLLLFIITRFTNDPLWMQLLHWLISISVVFVVLQFCPLPLRWTILFVFGYFMLYEYTVISRNYSIVVLTFFLSIHFYTKRQYLAWGIFLFILANTHLFGLILAFWFVISSIRDLQNASLVKTRRFITAICIFIFGAALSVIQIRPPGDSPFQPEASALLSAISIEKFLAIPIRGFLPIPDISNYSVWNSNLLTGVSRTLAGVLSVVLGLLLFFTMAQKKKPLILFTGVFFSVGIVMILLYPASIVQATRHFGMVYITFIGCLWLGNYEQPQKVAITLPEYISNGVISVLLFIQLLSGVSMLYFDTTRPFSEAKNVVTFLERNNLTTGIVASIDGPIPSVSCYLEKKIYSLSSGDLNSYYKWNNPTSAISIDSITLSEARTFASQSNSRLTLITYNPISTKLPHIIYLKGFTHAMIKVENFYVYEIIVSDSD